jgi:2-deoxy-D-gluconate 3-dehydrogenase
MTISRQVRCGGDYASGRARFQVRRYHETTLNAEKLVMTIFNLQKRIALVTGGNGGIGLGMAKGFAAAGASVVITGRNKTKAQSAVSELRAIGAQSEFVELDVLQEASCKQAIEQVVERFGRLDILVNNAGTAVRKQPQDLTAEDWHLVINTNLTAAFLCAQAAYSHMVRAGGGKIINIGSMMSIFGASYAAPYAASKGGIVQMTRALATAWAKDNIQVNAILPGWVDTELTRKAREQVSGLHERVLARTPAQRWGTPEDFAGIAVFLAAPASDFVTGTAIPIDGGYSIMG